MTNNTSLMLVNLGSPDSYNEQDVKKYLHDFLMDPYVIDLPYPLRVLIVKMILRKRPKITAQNYAKIWTEQGSPLLVNSYQLFNEIKKQYHGKVVLAMRYGKPSIAATLTQLADCNIDTIKLLPLYPQFTQSTVTSAINEVMRINRQQFAGKFKVKVVPPFFAHPAYINSLCTSLQPYLTEDFEHLVFSFHGVPIRHIRKFTNKLDKTHDLQRIHDLEIPAEILANCYRSQCLRTANLVARKLNLPAHKWSQAFQSRLGAGKWITPYLNDHLQSLGLDGLRNILIIAPSFVADCVETLEELAMRYADDFAQTYKGNIKVIPCLNAHSYWAKAIIEIVNTNNLIHT